MFCAKLAARKQVSKAAAATAAGGKTPAPGAKGKENSVPWLQTAMRSKLYRPPDEIKEISPVNERERSICPVLKRSRDGSGSAAAGERVLSPGKRHRLLDALDAEQREVLDAVREGRNVFFTGKAGTGKSFLLRKLLQVLPVKGATCR